jgi:glutamate-5-semialdehyde dehydrogenase
MDLKNEILEYGRRARAASRALAGMTSGQKNTGLRAIADALLDNQTEILRANGDDLAKAEKNGLSAAMIDRLRLDTSRIEKMAAGIRQVADLEDPVGKIISEWTRPNGIRITRVRVPIGVIGIIYESRPNVTSDASVLCIKTGNAAILRGGSESINSNVAIASAMREGGNKAGLPADAVILISTTDRRAVTLMAQMDQYIDLIVPRGGHALIEAVVSAARMPVIKHYHGVCMVYVDKAADLEMAARIVVNAKTQRPGVCNAMESLILHRDIAEAFLTGPGRALLEKGVEIRGDKAISELLGDRAKPATEADWSTEFLDLICTAKVVDSTEEAIAHIEKYGSHHSDCIVTGDPVEAQKFLNEVDSAAVYWNASTRFTDGGQFGFGAEIGISTDKLHARGPMALEELTTYKYMIRGEGQIVA